MTDYVLDENIILFATKISNEEGGDDVSCSFLMTGIVQRCDTIHCSKELFEKYFKSLKEMENRTPTAKHTARLLMMMKAKGAIKFQPYIPSFNKTDELKVPKDDLFLIKLVVYTKATLITKDCRLKDILAENGLITRYQIKIQKP